MPDSLILLDVLMRGMAVGAMIVIGLGVWRGDVSRHVRIATALAAVSIVAWLISESRTLWGAFGHSPALLIPTFPVGGLFWLLVVTVFEDRPIDASTLWPTGLLLVTGLLCEFASAPPVRDWLWATRNIVSALLAVHAAYVMARGWRGDLMEARRRLRAPLLGGAAVLTVIQVAGGLIYRLQPDERWLMITAGQPIGGAMLTVVILAASVLFLQAQPAAFGAPRRPEPAVDPRTEAAERLMLRKLSQFMEADGWRREGLTIGEVARALEAPEHRLRRLINHRLGHRNFADFVNGHRIEAAKRRLADPAEARTTVAAIAFDLGYGSLGPFNRAFRAATGATPSEWRKRALQASPDLKQAV